jgi:hypothetical protein
MLDEDLLNDVGTTLLLRCQDILTIYEAKRGRVKCARCARQGRSHMIQRPPRSRGDRRDQIVTCQECGWEITWGAYALSFKRKQLNPGGAVEIFSEYASVYQSARTPREKMLAIDRLVHEFHTSVIHDSERPVGVNLIQGKLSDVVEFLDRLTYGDSLPEEVEATRAAWRKRMQNTYWGDLVDQCLASRYNFEHED